MGGLTPAHLLLILIIALIVVGPGKLPEVGAAIGKSFREFQKATGEVQDSLTKTVAGQPQQSAPVVQQPGAPLPPAQSYYANQQTYAQPTYPQPVYPDPTQPVYPVQPGYPAPAPMQPVQYGAPVAPPEIVPGAAVAPSVDAPTDPRVG
jgi:sec-independent protein translocase protein TatA